MVIEYDPAEVDRFIEVADAVEDSFPGVMVEGVEVEGRPGAFDVALEDGTTVFSASPQQELPSSDELLAKLSEAGVQPAS